MNSCLLDGVFTLMWPRTQTDGKTHSHVKAAECKQSQKIRKIWRYWKNHCSLCCLPACASVSAVCVPRQVMWMWHQIVTSYPRARWGSLHVEPLDITVSSVNWPLTPGHFTLGVNDVFTPLHNKQHTPRAHRLTKEMCRLVAQTEKYKEVEKITLKFKCVSILSIFSCMLEHNSGLFQLKVLFL